MRAANIKVTDSSVVLDVINKLKQVAADEMCVLADGWLSYIYHLH